MCIRDSETDRTDWIAISTAQQWMELANVEDVPIGGDVNTSQQAEAWSKQYYLTADLDFSTLSAADQARTKSIGTVQNRFEGILDGNGHKLTGLTLSNYDSGLFAYIGAKGQVYDVTIEGANVLFSDNAAVLALNNYGTISSCRVINSNITADTGAVLGGMVSRNYCLLYPSGSAFQDDSDSSINDGYPMLKWQDPNATYTVSLSVTPANAVVSFDDETQAAQADGQYLSLIHI